MPTETKPTLPPEEVSAIHIALTAFQGDRVGAARELGLSPSELDEKIRESEELTTLWGRGKPEQVDAHDRDKPKFEVLEEAVDLGGHGISPKQAAIAEAVASQEGKLRKFDWEGLGVSDPDTISLMKQFEHSVGRGIMRLLDTMVGGMGFCFAQVSAQCAFAAKQLGDIRKKTADRDMTGEEKTDYAYWHSVFMDAAREMKGFNKEATNGMHTRLLIEERARKMQAATDKMRRPGWGKKQRNVTDGKAANG